MTKDYKLTIQDLEAINSFCEKYPTWWYKIGICSVTRDFDCAPQGHSPEIEYITSGKWPDDAFGCDHPGSLADAIYTVMGEIEFSKILAE